MPLTCQTSSGSVQRLPERPDFCPRYKAAAMGHDTSYSILLWWRLIHKTGILTAGKDTFLDEADRVLRAGLETASWISVDDTGARHKAANGVTTQIGNSH